MPPPAEYEPIHDDEILYRRVPVSMDWIKEDGVKPEAFGPREDDATGISVSRAIFVSVEEAARGLSKRGYWVVEMRAGDLRAAGIDVVPRPLDEVRGHSEIPSIAYRDPESDESMAKCKLLADELVIRIHGPFVPGP